MPERGLANALYYQVAGDEPAGKRAVAWAMGAAADTRQSALVFDWCQELLSKQQSADLARRLERSIAAPPAGTSIFEARTRALAAVLFDHTGRRRGAGADRARLVEGRTAQLRAGRRWCSRGRLSSVRCCTRRDAANLTCARPTGFSSEYPIEHLVSHYPASYPAAENEFASGPRARRGSRSAEAALSRAAEMAMVAYDVNAPSARCCRDG
jgi:hypothetical protein